MDKPKDICTLCNHFGDEACKEYCHSLSEFSPAKGSLKILKAMQDKAVFDFENSTGNLIVHRRVLAKSDNVNHPAHYAGHGGVECIEAIRASMSAEAFAGYCKGNVLKYLWRYQEKGGAEDLEKAKWYLNKLIEISGTAASAEPNHGNQCEAIVAAGQINLCSPVAKGENKCGEKDARNC